MRPKRSDIIRMARKRFVKKAGEKGVSPFEKVKDLIGSISSGVPDLGEARHKIGKILKESGLAVDEVLKGLKKEREAVYKKTYGKKSR